MAVVALRASPSAGSAPGSSARAGASPARRPRAWQLPSTAMRGPSRPVGGAGAVPPWCRPGWGASDNGAEKVNALRARRGRSFRATSRAGCQRTGHRRSPRRCAVVEEEGSKMALNPYTRSTGRAILAQGRDQRRRPSRSIRARSDTFAIGPDRQGRHRRLVLRAARRRGAARRRLQLLPDRAAAPRHERRGGRCPPVRHLLGPLRQPLLHAPVRAAVRPGLRPVRAGAEGVAARRRPLRRPVPPHRRAGGFRRARPRWSRPATRISPRCAACSRRSTCSC